MMIALLYLVIDVVAFLTVCTMLIVRGGGSRATRLLRIAALLVVPAVFFLWLACHLVKYQYSNTLDPFVVELRWALQNETLSDEKIVAAFADGDLERTERNLERLNRR